MAHIRNCLKHHSQEIGSRIINSIDNFDVFVVVTVQLFDIYNFRQQQLEKFPFFLSPRNTIILTRMNKKIESKFEYLLQESLY